MFGVGMFDNKALMILHAENVTYFVSRLEHVGFSSVRIARLE